MQVADNTATVNNAGSAEPTSTAFTTFTSIGTFTSDGQTSTGTRTITGSRAPTGSSTPGSSGTPGGTDGSQQASGASSKKNVGAIAGGAIGGIFILALVAALLVFFLRRRRRIHQEMNVTSHMAVPNPDLFRPTPGTGWDVESASNRSSSTSTSSGGPFVKPMAQTGPRLNVRKKPVPGLIPTAPSVSEDPFWDPSQNKGFDQVPITPVKTEQMQVKGPSTAAHNPFADPPAASAVPRRLAAEDGPSRLSSASSEFDAHGQRSSAPVSTTTAQ